MQYKKNIKIIIDKRKLDLLLRLNCPKEILFDTVINNKITKVGDELIDDTLESLIDIKEFKNWGGNHNPTGINQHSKKRGQVDQEVDQGQNIGQVVDKDIDKDIEIDKEIRIDYYSNPIIEQVFSIYKEHCTNLVKLGRFSTRNVELKKQIGLYLEQTESDLEYFARVCDIANKIKKIGSVNIDLKMILKNHDGFYNGKYQPVEEIDDYTTHDDSDWLIELEKKSKKELGIEG